MFAQLGSIAFEGLKGFTQFSDTRSANLVEHGRIEGKPRLQRVGSNLHQLNVTVLQHASFCNPEQEYTKLDDAREAAEILPLVLSNGVYVGDFVLESLQREVLHSDPRGNVVSQVVSLSLKEAYNPNPQQRLVQSAKQQAYATSDGGATPLRVFRPIGPTVAQAAVADISEAKLEAFRVNAQSLRAEIAPTERTYISAEMVAALGSIEQASLRAQQRILDPALAALSGGMPAALNAVLSSVNNLRAVLPIADMAAVMALNLSLQSTIQVLTGAASQLKNAVITRRL